MKKAALCIILTIAFLQSNSCSCFEGFKGYKDYPMTIGLASKMFQNLTLLEVIEKDSAGIKAKILMDYCNTYSFDTVFIANMDPGWQCGYSTDEFKKGDRLLTVLALSDYNNHLSICYESYIDVSNEETSGLISATKTVKAKTWKISEIESYFGITIKN